MSTRVKCSLCGKKTRHTDGVCESCRVHPTPVDSTETAIETETFKPVGFDEKNGGTTMRKIIDWTLRILGVAFLVALILFCGWLIRGCTAAPATATETTPAPTAAPAPTEVVIPTETIAPTSIGIDQPSKSWFIAEPGSMISGDVSIFDGDNNSRKIPVYDSDAGTADIIIIGGDTPVYIWTEWGCHYWAAPADQDLANQIENKLVDGFTTVRVFSGLTRENHNIEPETHTAA